MSVKPVLHFSGGFFLDHASKKNNENRRSQRNHCQYKAHELGALVIGDRRKVFRDVRWAVFAQKKASQWSRAESGGGLR